MATVDECRAALDRISERMRSKQGEQAAAEDFDRTLSCEVPDLGVTFTGRLAGGQISGLTTEPAEKAQIRLTTSSDDLIALTDGRLSFGSAWSSGRLKVQAGIRDMMKMRSLL